MPADFQLADTSVGSIFYPDRRHFGHFAHPVSKKQSLSQAKRPLSGDSQRTAFSRVAPVDLKVMAAL